MLAEAGDVTKILRRVGVGDPTEEERLYALVYKQLRRIASRRMAAERHDHSLQPTELVHEAYLKLALGEPVEWKDRKHFYSVASIVMRRLLVDHARRKRASKRDDAETLYLLDSAPGRSELIDVLALDEALLRLSTLSARQASIVELRCFGGLSVEEIASALEVSPRTVKRDWMVAKAWLQEQLRENQESSARDS